MVRGLAVSVVLVLAVASACFSESPAAGGHDATAGEPCTPGTLGCPCAEGACDAGLSCEPSIALCIDPACTPGTELCTCVDGSGCLAGLMCESGLCRVPSAGESTGGATATPPTSTGMPMDAGETFAGDADVTSASATDDASTSTPITEDGDPTATPACQQMECAQCYECVGLPGQGCSAAWDVCKATRGCGAAASCAWNCPQGTVGCPNDCCGQHGGGGGEYEALAACVELACPHCDLELSCFG